VWKGGQWSTLHPPHAGHAWGAPQGLCLRSEPPRLQHRHTHGQAHAWASTPMGKHTHGQAHACSTGTPMGKHTPAAQAHPWASTRTPCKLRPWAMCEHTEIVLTPTFDTHTQRTHTRPHSWGFFADKHATSLCSHASFPFNKGVPRALSLDTCQ